MKKISLPASKPNFQAKEEEEEQRRRRRRKKQLPAVPGSVAPKFETPCDVRPNSG